MHQQRASIRLEHMKHILFKRQQASGPSQRASIVPFRERPVGGRGGRGGRGAGGGREEEEDVLRKEERVGRAEDGVLSSTREAALRRARRLSRICVCVCVCVYIQREREGDR